MSVIRTANLAKSVRRQSAVDSTLAEICRGVTDIVPYLLIVALPLIFWLGANNIFDLPKVTVLRVLTLLATAAWVTRAVLRRRLAFLATPLARPVLAFAAALVLATVLSQAPVVSLFGINERQDGLLTQLNFVLLYFIVTNTLLTLPQIRLAISLHAGNGAVIAIIGILQYFGISSLGLSADYWGYRAFSTLGNPDFLGTYLVLVLPAAIGLALTAKTWRVRSAWLALGAIVAAGLILTFTRGAWVGAAVSLVVLIWWLKRDAWSARRSLGGLATAVLLLTLAAQLHWFAVLRPPGSTVQTASTQAPTVLEVGASAFDVNRGSAGNRLQIWRGTIDLVGSYPIFGVGLNALMGPLSQFVPREYAAGEGLRNFPDKAHNEILHLAATTGLAGLLTYVILLVAIVLLVRRGLSSLAGEKRSILAILSAAALGFFAQSMFLFPVIDTGALSWIILGLMVNLLPRDSRATFRCDLRSWSRPLVLVTALSLILAVGVLTAKPIVADMLAREGDLTLQGVHRAGDGAAAMAVSANDKYREAISWNPYDEQYYRRLASVLRIQAAGTTDRSQRRLLLGEAVRALNQAVSIDPKMAGLYYERAYTYQAFGDDHRIDALNDYRRAVKLYPYFYAANRALSDLARQMGRSDESVIADLAILAILPDDRQAQLALGDGYLLQGRMAEAIETWERLVQSDSQNAALFARLGWAYASNKRLDEARSAYRRAIAIDPQLEVAQSGLQALSEGGSE